MSSGCADHPAGVDYVRGETVSVAAGCHRLLEARRGGRRVDVMFCGGVSF